MLPVFLSNASKYPKNILKIPCPAKRNRKKSFNQKVHQKHSLFKRAKPDKPLLFRVFWCFKNLILPSGVGWGSKRKGTSISLSENPPFVLFKICSPGGFRTPNPLVNSQVLYPLSYRGVIVKL